VADAMPHEVVTGLQRGLPTFVTGVMVMSSLFPTFIGCWVVWPLTPIPFQSCKMRKPDATDLAIVFSFAFLLCGERLCV